MKKTIFLIVLIFVLQSCSSSIYYAYEKDGDYCTLEITKYDEVLYRGVSKNYRDLGYIYIYGFDRYHSTSFKIFDFYSLYYLKTNNDNKYEACGSSGDLNNIDKRSLIVYSKKNKDSLDLLWTPNIKANLLKEECFKKNNLEWFAPYMKRIKKIDYKKFNLPQIKTKYLKNPKNAPKVND